MDFLYKYYLFPFTSPKRENVLQSFEKILFSGRKYGKWSSIERDIKLYGT
jgi:hypothetical protein